MKSLSMHYTWYGLVAQDIKGCLVLKDRNIKRLNQNISTKTSQPKRSNINNYLASETESYHINLKYELNRLPKRY